MNRNVVIALVIGLAVGFAVGWSVGHNLSQETGPVVAAPVTMPPGNAGLREAMPAPRDLEARVAMSERIAKENPKDAQAWVDLGNVYFDTHQAKKSVEAYQKALELRPDDPDVLTDQGVMYRELKEYDRAVANFEKANQLNPHHLQSLFNLGVVYSHDLHQDDKAVAAWTKIIEIDPSSAQAAQARTALKQLPGAGSP